MSNSKGWLELGLRHHLNKNQENCRNVDKTKKKYCKFVEWPGDSTVVWDPGYVQFSDLTLIEQGAHLLVQDPHSKSHNRTENTLTSVVFIEHFLEACREYFQYLLIGLNLTRKPLVWL